MIYPKYTNTFLHLNICTIYFHNNMFKHCNFLNNTQISIVFHIVWLYKIRDGSYQLGNHH